VTDQEIAMLDSYKKLSEDWYQKWLASTVEKRTVRDQLTLCQQQCQKMSDDNHILRERLHSITNTLQELTNRFSDATTAIRGVLQR
jgi:hypothetical protein